MQLKMGDNRNKSGAREDSWEPLGFGAREDSWEPLGLQDQTNQS